MKVTVATFGLSTIALAVVCMAEEKSDLAEVTDL